MKKLIFIFTLLCFVISATAQTNADYEKKRLGPWYNLVVSGQTWTPMTHTVTYYDSTPATKASYFRYSMLNNTVSVNGYVSFTTDADDVVDSILVTMPASIGPKYLGYKTIVPAFKYRTDTTGYYSFFNLQTDSTQLQYRRMLKPFHTFTETVSKSYIYYFDYNFEIPNSD